MDRGIHSLKHLICLCTLDKVILSVKFSVRLQQLTVLQFPVQPSALFPTAPAQLTAHANVCWSFAQLIASAASYFFCYSSTSACLRSFFKNNAYSEWACLTACIKSLVMGTLVQQPNPQTASFTTWTVTILLSDNDPRSVITRALFTENSRSRDALLCDRISAAFATKLRYWYFFTRTVSTILDTCTQ